MSTRVIPKTELRDAIRAELADLREDTLLVTDRGRPSAVVISVERWNALQERIEDLEDSIAVLEARGDPGVSRPVVEVLEELDEDVRGPARATG